MLANNIQSKSDRDSIDRICLSQKEAGKNEKDIWIDTCFDDADHVAAMYGTGGDPKNPRIPLSPCYWREMQEQRM